MIVTKASKEELKQASCLNEPLVDSVHLQDCPAVIVPVDDDLSALLSPPTGILAAAREWPGEEPHDCTNHEKRDTRWVLHKDVIEALSEEKLPDQLQCLRQDPYDCVDEVENAWELLESIDYCSR